MNNQCGSALLAVSNLGSMERELNFDVGEIISYNFRSSSLGECLFGLRMVSEEYDSYILMVQSEEGSFPTNETAELGAVWRCWMTSWINVCLWFMDVLV